MQFSSNSQGHSSQRLKIYTKVHLEKQKTANSQGNTEQKNNTGGTTISNSKLYYRAIAIKTAWYWQQSSYEDQRNRIEDLEMNPHSCPHLIFDKGTKNMQWKKVCSTNVVGKSGYPPAEN
jgi:hypothetical protein